jgi:hypothetical protein
MITHPKQTMCGACCVLCASTEVLSLFFRVKQSNTFFNHNTDPPSEVPLIAEMKKDFHQYEKRRHRQSLEKVIEKGW